MDTSRSKLPSQSLKVDQDSDRGATEIDSIKEEEGDEEGEDDDGASNKPVVVNIVGLV